MGRLFDAGQEQQKATAAADKRAEVKRRAEEVDAALREAGLLDNAADKLGQRLGVQATQSVQPLHYEQFRKPGSKWMIEHARDGQDYVFQLFPLKPPAVEWNDAMPLLIAAMDVIFPRSIEIRYMPPNPQYSVQYFTIRVVGVTTQPGWEDACRTRTLANLAAVDVWSSSPATR